MESCGQNDGAVHTLRRKAATCYAFVTYAAARLGCFHDLVAVMRNTLTIEEPAPKHTGTTQTKSLKHCTLRQLHRSPWIMSRGNKRNCIGCNQLNTATELYATQERLSKRRKYLARISFRFRASKLHLMPYLSGFSPGHNWTSRLTVAPLMRERPDKSRWDKSGNGPELIRWLKRGAKSQKRIS